MSPFQSLPLKRTWPGEILTLSYVWMIVQNLTQIKHHVLCKALATKEGLSNYWFPPTALLPVALKKRKVWFPTIPLTDIQCHRSSVCPCGRTVCLGCEPDSPWVCCRLPQQCEWWWRIWLGCSFEGSMSLWLPKMTAWWCWGKLWQSEKPRPWEYVCAHKWIITPLQAELPLSHPNFWHHGHILTWTQLWGSRKGQIGNVWVRWLQPVNRGKNLQVLITTMETSVWAEEKDLLIIRSQPFHSKDQVYLPAWICISNICWCVYLHKRTKMQKSADSLNWSHVHMEVIWNL